MRIADAGEDEGDGKSEGEGRGKAAEVRGIITNCRAIFYGSHKETS